MGEEWGGVPVGAEGLRLLRKKLPVGEGVVLRRAVGMGESGLAVDAARSEVSWISTERVDHEGDLVLAAGMDDSIFALNPIVTLNHDYTAPPVGRSLWRRTGHRLGIQGILARTHYPVRPEGLSPQKEWIPDRVLDLVQSGLAIGKSIGFVPLETRAPTSRERETTPGGKSLKRVIEKWLLLEYAVCWIPANPGALVDGATGDISRPKSLERKLGKWLDWVVESRSGNFPRCRHD